MSPIGLYLVEWAYPDMIHGTCIREDGIKQYFDHCKIGVGEEWFFSKLGEDGQGCDASAEKVQPTLQQRMRYWQPQSGMWEEDSHLVYVFFGDEIWDWFLVAETDIAWWLYHKGRQEYCSQVVCLWLQKRMLWNHCRYDQHRERYAPSPSRNSSWA